MKMGSTTEAEQGRQKGESEEHPLQVIYEIREASTLITSHDPITWTPSVLYPVGICDKDFGHSEGARHRVEEIAQEPDPKRLLCVKPGTPVSTGAPLLASVSGIDGIVWQGNARAMGLKLAYELGTATAYRKALVKRSLALGYPAGFVDKMKAPVLVRAVVLQDEKLKSLSRWNELTEDQADLSDRDATTNDGASQSGSDNSLLILSNGDGMLEAVDDARRLTARAMVQIGKIAAKTTLAEALEEGTQDIARILASEGVITLKNRGAWLRGTSLSRMGKARLQMAFLAYGAGTAERLRLIDQTTAQKLERLIPAMAKVDARHNQLGITQDVRQAIDALHDFSLKCEDVPEFQLNDYLDQLDFTRTLSERTKTMARCLHGMTRQELGKVADAWCKSADIPPPQLGLFDTQPTQADPFQIWEDAQEPLLRQTT